jgi:acyl-CoA synthetase (AMP-forming)/AMP-acid ligase II
MKIDFIVRRGARSKGDKIALVDGDKSISYNEYFTRTENFAYWVINELKVQPEDRIALLLENSIEICVAYYSIPKTSAITVPLNFFMARDEILYCLNDCKPIALIYGNRFAEDIEFYKKECPNIKEFIPEDRFNEISTTPLPRKAKVKPPKSVLETDTVFVAYTGGTTGFPKGVMLTHKGLMTNMMQSGDSLVSSLNVNPETRGQALEMLEDTVLIPIPIFHLAAMLVFLLASFLGYTIYIHRGFKAEKIVQDVDRFKINHIVCVPTNIITMIEFLETEEGKKYDVSSLTQLTYGAAPISATVLDRIMNLLPHTSFRQAYGQTEYSPVISQMTSEDHVLAKKYPELLKSAGQPQIGTEVAIVDENGNFLPKGNIGEVVASGISIMRGYWNNPNLTQNTIREIDGKTWLFTGDMGYLKDYDGKEFLFLVDRAKDMIVSGGENVYPAEIENVIYQLPQVKMCAVIGIPDEKWGEAVTVLVIPKQGASITEEEIIKYCGDHLAGYKKPKQVIFKDDFPLSPQGKILKKELRKEFWGEADRQIV